VNCVNLNKNTPKKCGKYINQSKNSLLIVRNEKEGLYFFRIL